MQDNTPAPESAQDVQDSPQESEFIVPAEQDARQNDTPDAPAPEKAEDDAPEEPADKAVEDAPEQTKEEVAAKRFKERQARRDREVYEMREAQRQLLAEINSLKQARTAPEQTIPETPEPPDPTDLVKFPYGQYGDDFVAAQQKYLADRDNYILAKASETAREAAESVQTEARDTVRLSRINDRVMEVGQLGLDKYPDFDEALQDAFGAMRRDDPFVDALRNLALQDGAEDVVYHLAKNGDVLDRITGMDPMAQAFEMGRLASQLSAKRNLAEKSVSKAQPTPKTPRGASGQFASSKDALYDRMLKAYR